jgi:hypothetical protein
MGKQESKEFEEFKEGRRKISRKDAKAQRFGLRESRFLDLASLGSGSGNVHLCHARGFRGHCQK